MRDGCGRNYQRLTFMAWKQTIERTRGLVRTEHGRQRRRTEAEKLKVLISWRHWRSQGYGPTVLVKRLKVSTESIQKWAKELGFDLEAKGRKESQSQTQAGSAVTRTEGGEG